MWTILANALVGAAEALAGLCGHGHEQVTHSATTKQRDCKEDNFCILNTESTGVGYSPGMAMAEVVSQ